MELKISNQSTYFLQSYIVNQGKYTRYILKLLDDKRFKLKIFEKNKDLELYTEFLPKIRELLFSTFDLDDIEKMEKFKNLPNETKAAILSKYSSITFEYDLTQEIKGKIDDENSIFFKIEKIGMVLFNTGICFIYLKTNLENSSKFSDVLEFNNKFRELKKRDKRIENIKIQAGAFENIEEIQDFIASIIGSNVDLLKLNIDTEKFYTFSLTFLDKEYWNEEKDFKNIEEEFLKYINILPGHTNANSLSNDGTRVIANSKYSKIGISKLGVNILSSDFDTQNKNILAKKFDKDYLYIYILSLYLKIYLKKINYKFKQGKEIEKVRKEFIDFTKNIFIQEITSNDIESLYYTYIKDVLEIEQLYDNVKNKYNVLYNELKIEKNEIRTRIVTVLLIVTLLINIVNLILFFKT